MKKLLSFVLFLGLLILKTKSTFPLFKQCDYRWGEDILGFGTDTICEIGCAITSVAMILNNYGIKVDGKETFPNTFNIWLKNNDGYHEKIDYQ